MTRRRRLERLVLVGALVGLQAGCGAGAGADAAGPGPSAGASYAAEPRPSVSRPGRADNDRRLRERARVVLGNYEKALVARPFIPVEGGDTDVIGAGGERLQRIAAAGRLEAGATLPLAPRETGTVVWRSGDPLTVRLLSASQALAQLQLTNQADCQGCPIVKVIGARLTTMRAMTTRGEATAPAWEYTLAGSKLRVTRVAFKGGSPLRVDPPAGDPERIPEGAVAESVHVRGTRMTVKFTGPQRGADQPCGADYTAEAVESRNAVAVLIREQPYTGEYPENYGCLAVGYARTATVTLAKPLGGRAVLEVQQGQPVLSVR
ncbi:hypothetical protein [Actinoplanes sp. URMC 104]|uniref:hypothetical protein n=1 Tax=Actinoplanes sp. URMC 104 TaxID=3423409 RepID=UPI003F1CDE1D